MENERILEEYKEQLKIKKILDNKLKKYDIEKSRQNYKNDIIKALNTYNEIKDSSQEIIGALARFTDETSSYWHKNLNLPMSS